MPAIIVDVGHHMVEPHSSGQTVEISVSSSAAKGDSSVAGFLLEAQLGNGVISGLTPRFESVDFSTDIWSRSAHQESGGPLPGNPHLAAGEVRFTTTYATSANGIVVELSVSTLGIPAGSFPLSLAGTLTGTSVFLDADGSPLPTIVINGTLQVRSIWQNPENSLDVNGDGEVSPIDILRLINYLNKYGSGELPFPSAGNSPPPYLDVNGDGDIAPNDALLIVNCINGGPCDLAPMPIVAVPIPLPAEPTDPGPGEEEGSGEPPVDPYTHYCLTHEDDPYCDNFPGTPGSVLPPGQPSSDSVDSDLPVSTDDQTSAPGPAGSGLASAPSSGLIDQVLSEFKDDTTSDSIVEELIDSGLGWDLLASTT